MTRRTPLLFASLFLALAGSAAAQAQTELTRNDVRARQVRIEEQYDQAQASCRRAQLPVRELCNERARGERDIQSAELQLLAEPSADNDHKLRLARAEARYAQSLAACKGMDGQARDVCRADAKTSFTQARAEANLQREVAEQSLRADLRVRTHAAESDRIAQAQFQAASKRCEALPAEGRANCLADAKRRLEAN